MIRFKKISTSLKEEFEYLDIRLQIILYAIGGFLYHRFNKFLTVTDLYRGDVGSIHHFYRGADMRTNDLTEEEGNAVVELVNDHFIYGTLVDGKQVKFCLFDERKRESENWTGAHFHLQVDPSGTMEIRKVL